MGLLNFFMDFTSVNCEDKYTSERTLMEEAAYFLRINPADMVDSQIVISWIKDITYSTFRIKDLGDLHYFHDLEFFKSQNGKYLGQHKFFFDEIKKFH